MRWEVGQGDAPVLEAVGAAAGEAAGKGKAQAVDWSRLPADPGGAAGEFFKAVRKKAEIVVLGVVDKGKKEL